MNCFSCFFKEAGNPTRCKLYSESIEDMENYRCGWYASNTFEAVRNIKTRCGGCTKLSRCKSIVSSLYNRGQTGSCTHYNDPMPTMKGTIQRMSKDRGRDLEMSKWTYQPGVDAAAGKHFVYDADGEMTSGEWIGEACDEETAQQIVREHNAHAELLICLKAMLKHDCGECRGEELKKSCYVEPEVCALSAQARAAIEAAEGRE